MVVENVTLNEEEFTQSIKFKSDLDLEGGYSYLIKNKNKKLSQHLVTNKHLVGKELLYITRNSPKDLFKDTEIINKSTIWLTYNKGPNCIEPTNITRLSIKIQEFLKRNKGATILVDGLEYLTSQNDFHTILHFIQLMNDKIMISDSKLILSLNPNAFKPNELAMIEREMETLDR
jgi:hypothetical protein